MIDVGSVTANLDPPPRLNRANGYYTVSVGRGTPGASSNGRVYLHRFVLERHLGRELAPEEVVHHRGDRELNDPHDLLLFGSQGDHLHWHALERSGRLLERAMLPVAVGRPST